MSRIELISRGLAWSDDGRRLLVCEPSSGAYAYLPGGHVEFSECAREALRREMAEECGIQVEIGGLIAVCESGFDQNGRRRHELNLLFHMKHSLPDTVPSIEPAIRFRWVDVDRIGEVHLLPFAVRGAIERGLIAADSRHPPLFLSDLDQPAD